MELSNATVHLVYTLCEHICENYDGDTTERQLARKIIESIVEDSDS
jgi:hypothetical protein